MKVAFFSVLALAVMASVASAQVNIHFTNPTSEPAQVEWINGGSATYYMTVPPGETRSLQSYVGHQWRFSNSQAVTGRGVTGENQVITLAAAPVAAPAPRPAPAAPMLPEAAPEVQLPQFQPTRPQTQMPSQSQPASANQGMVNFARSVVGQRIGNGQCTELAIAALRSAGAQPNQGYVWGAGLRSVDQLQPGDIVQLYAARFDYPNGSWAAFPSQHTAVVTGVEGSTIHVLEQNIAGSPVQEGHYDVSYLTAGRIELYRPVAANVASQRPAYTQQQPVRKIPVGWTAPRQPRVNELTLPQIRLFE